MMGTGWIVVGWVVGLFLSYVYVTWRDRKKKKDEAKRFLEGFDG